MKIVKRINFDKSFMMNKDGGERETIEINMPEKDINKVNSEKLFIKVNMPEEKDDGGKANEDETPLLINLAPKSNEKDKMLNIANESDKIDQFNKESKLSDAFIEDTDEDDGGISKEEVRALLSKNVQGVASDKNKSNDKKDSSKELSILKMKNINCNELAAYILGTTKCIFFNNSLYYYNKPIYQRINEHEGKTLIKSILPCDIVKKLSDYNLKEILNQIRTTPEIQMDNETVKVKERYICFKNAVYDIKKRRFTQHSHENYFFSYVNVNYNPNNVECGKSFENYLEKCTGGDEELKELICQVIGYILSNSMAAKKMFILVGAPDSGKSTFGEFLEALIGAENCCSIALQDLSKRFQVAELCGKKLCFNMDIPDAPIKETGTIKQLTGNDSIPSERKYEAPFKFKNEAKLLYGANILPYIENAQKARAFFNRLVIIPFNVSIKKSEQDKKLKAKLLKERNYITHKCIQAFERLRDNNFEFSRSSSSDLVKQKYINSSNNVLEFVNERCKLDNKLRIYKTYLYEHYVEFCKSNGYGEKEIFSDRKFNNIINDNFDVTSYRWREGELNLYGFIGISIKK